MAASEVSPKKLPIPKLVPNPPSTPTTPNHETATPIPNNEAPLLTGDGEPEYPDEKVLVPPTKASMAASLRSTSKPTADIAVCVPCIPRDISSLPNLLRSIRDNTMLPAQVLIALSETPENEGEELEKMLRSIIPGVEVIATPEQQYAGQNRNRAASRATTSLLTFFDADDEMHFERIQIVTEASQVSMAKCVLHSFTFKRNEIKKHFNWRSANQVKGTQIYKDVLRMEGTKTINPDGPGLHLAWVHHGHPTCRREVLRDVQFTSRPRGQDAVFLRQVLGRYGQHDTTMLFVDVPLTLYHPSDHTDNEWAKQYEAELSALQSRIMSQKK